MKPSTTHSSAQRDIVVKGEETEALVWQRIWDAAPPEVRSALGLSCKHEGFVRAFQADKAPSWFFNRVVGLGLDAPATREQVDALLAPYSELGLPHGVPLVDIAQPKSLPTWLEERGLKHTTTLARMLRSTSNLPTGSSDIQIRSVGREHAGLFGETTVQGFQLPPACVDWFAGLCGREGLRAYLAFEANEPIATGVLCVVGDTGWLGFGSTLSKARNRGVHRAMMLRRMIDAADLGCRWLQTETNLAVADEPTPSLNNMKRLGFEIAYERPNYIFTP
jgi:hypothetical protein